MKRIFTTTAVLAFCCITAFANDITIPSGDSEALRRALVSVSGPAIITLEPGRYDLWPEESVHEWIFVSCTSSEIECADKTKIFGIWLNGLSDVAINGEGATLVCHGDMTPIGISECKNITLKGLEVDFERPGMSELTYVSCVPGRTVMNFHKDSWYKIEDGILWLVGENWKTEHPHCIKYTHGDGRLLYCKDWDLLSKCRATEIEPGMVCFETPIDFKAEPGDVLTIRDHIRRQTGSLIRYSENIHLEGMKYRFMHGIGVMSEFTRNVSMNDCVFAPSKESGRLMASSADFAHFSGCAGLVEIRNCIFCGAQDDPINVHGTNLRAVRKISDNSAVVRFMHHQTYGIKAFFTGDEVVFVHADNLQRYQKAVVTKAERIDDREILLTFDRSLPENLILGSDCIENMTWNPEVIICDNHFSRISTRGILLTTPCKSVIENNEFHQMGMNGILIGADACDWYSSGPACDVTIRGNFFEDCTFNGGPDNAYIAIHPSIKEVDKDLPVDRNIRIEENTFILRDSCPALSAKSVRGLTFRDNIITGAGESPIILYGCTKVKSDVDSCIVD